MNQNSQIKINDLCINLSKLKSKSELISHLEKNGATYSSLMDFCEGYMKQYHNQLFWHYPITDELHLGMFFCFGKRRHTLSPI